MNYAFTDRVRKVLAMAREEAIRVRNDFVGSEHILLALLKEGEGLAVTVLEKLGADPQQLVTRTEASLRPGKASPRLGDLPYTSGAKRVLENSMRAARDLGHTYVGTEHLLLGLLRGDKGVAGKALEQFEVTYESASEETLRVLGGAPRRNEESRGGGGWLRRFLGSAQPEPGIHVGPAREARPPGFAIVIDDGSSASIYEQIIAQVQEAVATGRLQPGDRLPAVRQLADALDIAPGTVARAYSELERLGVVVTEGARGTRVAERPKNPLPADERPDTLSGLLRPVVVAAFHLGATARELREALERAMRGIFDDEKGTAGS